MGKKTVFEKTVSNNQKDGVSFEIRVKNDDIELTVNDGNEKCTQKIKNGKATTQKSKKCVEKVEDCGVRDYRKARTVSLQAEKCQSNNEKSKVCFEISEKPCTFKKCKKSKKCTEKERDCKVDILVKACPDKKKKCKVKTPKCDDCSPKKPWFSHLKRRFRSAEPCVECQEVFECPTFGCSTRLPCSLCKVNRRRTTSSWEVEPESPCMSECEPEIEDGTTQTDDLQENFIEEACYQPVKILLQGEMVCEGNEQSLESCTKLEKPLNCPNLPVTSPRFQTTYGRNFYVKLLNV